MPLPIPTVGPEASPPSAFARFAPSPILFHYQITFLKHRLSPCLGWGLPALIWISSENLSLAQFHPAAPVQLSQVFRGQPLQAIPGSAPPLEGIGEREGRRGARRAGSLQKSSALTAALPSLCSPALQILPVSHTPLLKGLFKTSPLGCAGGLCRRLRTSEESMGSRLQKEAFEL